MEKYRKWTDESTGINPFMTAKKSVRAFSPRRPISLAIGLVRLCLAVLMVGLGLGLMFIDSLFGLGAVLGSVNRVYWSLFCAISMGINADDTHFRQVVLPKARKNKGALILSNSLSVLDVFYFLSTYQFPNQVYTALSFSSQTHPRLNFNQFKAFLYLAHF